MGVSISPLPTVLVAVSVVIVAGASEITKLKSNPEGNFAIGYKKGYINSGLYAVIVPKGELKEDREVQIQGPDVRDSLSMVFNTHTIVFSNWDGMFMLGEHVYTDTPGTLYFVMSDHKCNKKVFQKQTGEVRVISSDKLDKEVCEKVRAKVEEALSKYLTKPFQFLLPEAEVPLTLKNSPGFPGGDYMTGMIYGKFECGQYTVELPSGDASMKREIKVTAPGVSDEIKMKFDYQTKVFGSWNGAFYLGDKVFSVEPRTLVITKGDGSCVKKTYETKGSDIVVAHSELLKQENCFLIKSRVFADFQELIGPPDDISENSIAVKSQSQTVNIALPTVKQNSLSDQSTPSQHASTPIQVTSTVVFPEANQPSATPGAAVLQLVPQTNAAKKRIGDLYLLGSTMQSPTDTISSGRIVQVVSQPESVNLQFNNADLSEQSKIMNIQANVQQSNEKNDETKGAYVVANNIQDPTKTIILQPGSVQQLKDVYQLRQGFNVLPNKVSKAANIQINDIKKQGVTLQAESNPIILQAIEPNQEIVSPDVFVRHGRSIIQEPQKTTVVNKQETNIDEIENFKKPTTIVSVQRSNILGPTEPDGTTLMTNIKATQVTTVKLPPGVKSLKSNEDQTPIFIDTKVILNPDDDKKIHVGKQDRTSQDSSSPIIINTIDPSSQLLLPVVSLDSSIGEQSAKTFKLQYNKENLPQGDVMHTRINEAIMKSDSLQNVESIIKATAPSPHIDVVGHLRSVSQRPEESLNLQINKVNLAEGGKSSNIQINDVKMISKPLPLSSDVVLKAVVPSPYIDLVRFRRSLSEGSQRQNVLNNQVTNIDGSNQGSPPKKILNVQQNDIMLQMGPNGLPTIPKMEATQVTTIGIVSKSESSEGNSKSLKNTLPLNINAKLFNQVKPDNVQPSKVVPVYVQSQSSSDTVLRKQESLFTIPSSTFSLMKLIPSTVLLRANVVAKPENLGVLNIEPEIILSSKPAGQWLS